MTLSIRRFFDDSDEIPSELTATVGYPDGSALIQIECNTPGIALFHSLTAADVKALRKLLK